MELLGAVPHNKVRSVLVRGHIFLNCSLTESFCIALLEAASCGLYIVSTQVGGVSEVLPLSMIKFAEPNAASLADALMEAMTLSKNVIPFQFHERVKTMYSWLDVARRTEIVYDNIARMRRISLPVRLMRYITSGFVSGPILCFVVAAMSIFLNVLEITNPLSEIEMCPDINLIMQNNHLNQNSNKRVNVTEN